MTELFPADGQTIIKHEASRLIVPERLVPVACHSTLVHCSVGLDRHPAIPACYFRQCLLTAYPDDCLLSTGCRTDIMIDRHDKTNSRF